MGSRFRIRTDPSYNNMTTRGQNISIVFVDEFGTEHAIKNCKSLTFKAAARADPCELTLVLMGELDIDVSTEVAATLIKQDDS